MDDAFSGGVEPGGLRSQNDIRVLLCFLLLKAGDSFLGEELLEIVARQGLANYFEAGDALSSLIKQGNIKKNRDGVLSLTPRGREIAETLMGDLPLSVREKALDSALLLLGKKRRLSGTSTEIEESKDGFSVICRVGDGSRELLSVRLYAPDLISARRIEENFKEHPGEVYRALLSALTGEESFLKNDDGGEGSK